MESYRVRKERQGEEWRRTEQGKTDNVCKAPKGIFLLLAVREVA